MKEMVQVQLQSGTTFLTCWVENRRKVRVGNRLTLKDSLYPDKLWTIIGISLPKNSEFIHKDWKVGGIE